MTVAKLWYLKKINLFSALDEDAIEALGKMTRMDEVPKNQPIYFPGDAADRVYFLKKGRVQISRHTPDGRRITLALLEPGEIFGELAITGEQERSTSTRTVEDSFVCVISRDRFTEFLSDHPELAFKVTQLMGDRRRQIESKIENLIFKDAAERLAFILEDLFENYNDPSQNGDGDRASISFSHQEIADLAGLTRPTTTSLLNEFENEGMISLGRRKIHLEDAAALRRRTSD